MNEHTSEYLEIPVGKILPNPQQPRKEFDPAELRSLADSILENGVLLPILVERGDKGFFILHDGERRLRASKLAGMKTIRAVVEPPLNGSGPVDRTVRALVTNIQRVDLSPIEEAKAYEQLHEMGLSDIQIGLKLGISVSRVSRYRKMLRLEPETQAQIDSGKLSRDPRVVDALLALPDGTTQAKLATRLAEKRAGGSVKACLEACERVQQHLREEKIGKDEVPALRLSMRKAGEVNRPVWDAMMQVGRVPPWILVEISARETCKRCALRDTASSTVCAGCPLVEVLERMIGGTK